MGFEPGQSAAEADGGASRSRSSGFCIESAPDRCCGLRKVEPLFGAVANYDVWFTGLRREQSPTRANLQPVDNFRLPGGKELRKVSPLAIGRIAKSGRI